LKKPQYILDAYAFFAHFGYNPGGEQVSDLLQAAQDEEYELFVSDINLGEVVYWIERVLGRGQAMETLAVIRQLSVRQCGATWPRILSAAHVKAHHPISYADAFAVALAQELEAPVVTGDPEFECVEDLIDVTWLPAKK
jgi:ribonuclease VapC